MNADKSFDFLIFVHSRLSAALFFHGFYGHGAAGLSHGMLHSWFMAAVTVARGHHRHHATSLRRALG
ncbi:MAG: hypothetical protein ABSH45_19720 [Bryobacteraceae bacterium]|jgi:hypothetical protein